MTDRYKSLVAPQCKIDEHTVKIIFEHIAEGNYISTACCAAGIDQHTYMNWCARAKAGEEPFVSFAQEMDVARAQAEAARIGRITKAGTGGALTREREVIYKDGTVKKECAYAAPQWQADAWTSERTDPQKYAQTTRIHQTIEVSPEILAYRVRHAEDLKRLQEAEVLEGEVIAKGQSEDELSA